MFSYSQDKKNRQLQTSELFNSHVTLHCNTKILQEGNQISLNSRYFPIKIEHHYFHPCMLHLSSCLQDTTEVVFFDVSSWQNRHFIILNLALRS